MDEGNPLATIKTTGSVASRFVTQTEIDSAKEKRDADWKAAYARLGQEPPPRQVDEQYDGRSLYERLQSQRTAKQEEWEEKNKLSNQFRALEEDEIHFLDGVINEKIIKEKKRKEEENEELKSFREAVAQNSTQHSPPSSKTKPTTTKAVSGSAPAPKTQPKKNQRALLKGAIVRKSGPAIKSSSVVSPSSATLTPKADPAKGDVAPGTKRSESSVSEAGGEEQPAKRRKV